MNLFFVKKKWTPLFSSIKYILFLVLLINVSCESEEFDPSNESEFDKETLEKSTPVSGSIYYIRNRNSGLHMEVANASNSDGANVQQLGDASGTHRQWEILSVEDDYVRLRGIDSRKSLTVENGSNSDGANIEIRAFDGSTNQQWEILSTGDGFFRLRSRDSRKSIGVENQSTSAGANIESRSFDDSETFEWFFTEVDGSNGGDNGGNEGDGAFNLDPNLEPWENFDLDDWAIDTPAERENDECRAVRSGEDEWDQFRASTSSPYFFTHTDGGMRFVSRVDGATTNTSCDSGFPRSELRENLRRGNTNISETGVNPNNWALGYQPTGTDHGGRNGVLTATLRINQVSTTGDGLHPGRTIIGQIHAQDDEPARLYYRKLPDAEFGCLYLEHEIGDNCITFNLIGDERCSGNGPSNGIRLNELFSYEIINEGEFVRVVIHRGDFDGETIAEAEVDMDEMNSGYDTSDEWMYFKAGAYTQNNTGDAGDRDVITFYRLNNTHDPN